MAAPVIFWFRRDLRWRDNHALWAALKTNSEVIPIFIFDKGILSEFKNHEDPRVGFLHQRVSEIDLHFKTLNSGLRVFHGNPVEIFKVLISEFSPKAVFANEDYEPAAVHRDQRVAELLTNSGTEFRLFKDQVIFAKDEVLKDDGKPYTVFTPYSRKWLKLLPEELPNYPSEKYLEKLKVGPVQPILSLKDLGFSPSSISLPSASISKKTLISYGKTRNYPALATGTTKVGLHLRFGTLSVRKAVEVARELSPVWLNELIWREFFMMIIHHFPHTVTEPFRPAYKNIKWRKSQKDFESWCLGQTGYPMVDAGMRELVATGHMHNRVRMVVASFLTKHLLLDWRMGERFFAQHLLDFELSSNVGNWQWAAGCGCDAAPYFRVFNPELQAKKFDPKNEYIKHWIPELGSKEYPSPIVDHDLARQRALQVYSEGIKGNKE